MSADGPRLVTPDEVGRQGLTLAFEAGAAERKALVRRLDLLALEALAAELRFAPADDAPGAIRVSGTMRASLVQRCVATLAPVPRELCERISVLYAPPPPDAPGREVDVAADGEEAEPLPAAGIDAGAVVAEHLALVIDPYPRHPDAPAGPLSYGTDDDGGGGPFAALGQLKSKL